MLFLSEEVPAGDRNTFRRTAIPAIRPLPRRTHTVNLPSTSFRATGRIQKGRHSVHAHFH